MTGRDQVTRHEERAAVTSEWVPVSRVRMVRRIVTEIQTIDVEVRREELVVTEEPVPAAGQRPFAAGEAPRVADPFVFVLSAEVPFVSLRVLPVERVTVTPVVVEGRRALDVALSAEQLDLTHSPIERGVS